MHVYIVYKPVFLCVDFCSILQLQTVLSIIVFPVHWSLIFFCWICARNLVQYLNRPKSKTTLIFRRVCHVAAPVAKSAVSDCILLYTVLVSWCWFAFLSVLWSVLPYIFVTMFWYFGQITDCIYLPSLVSLYWLWPNILAAVQFSLLPPLASHCWCTGSRTVKLILHAASPWTQTASQVIRHLRHDLKLRKGPRQSPASCSWTYLRKNAGKYCA